MSTGDAGHAAPPSRGLLLLLVGVTAAAPVSLQMFMPALPALHRDFAAAPGTVQLTLSLAILANAFATLAYGPLSDRLGRRPVLLAGLALFLAGSLGAWLAPTIGWLIAFRILQAAGACSGMVLARAILRDLYEAHAAARAIAYLTVAMVAAPMVSPALGALLVEASGWRAVFAATAVAAAILLAWSAGAARLLRRPLFLGYLLQSGFAVATFFAFLGGAPYFMVDVLGRSPTDYGLWFVLVSGAFMGGNLVSGRIVARVGINRLVVAGSLASVIGTGIGLALLGAGQWSAPVLFGSMAVAAVGNGLSLPNAMAGAMSIDSRLAGTASGVLGFAQMLLSAVASQWVGVHLDGTPYPMAIAMLACATISLGGLLAALRAEPATPR